MGRAAYEPIWAQDAASAVLGALEAEPGRYELAGPERLTYEQIARLIAALGRPGATLPPRPAPLRALRR